jgi:hypothetical protein
MTLEIAVIVKDAGHLNYPVLTAAIEKEMSRFFHLSTAHSSSAERNVVSPRPFGHGFRAFGRAWPFRIGLDIQQRLPDEGSIAPRRGLAEFLEAPFHDGGYVAAGGTGNVKLEAALLSHASARR